jgi:CpeT protein
MMLKIKISLVVILLSFYSCNTTQDMNKKNDLKRLAMYMTGDFSSTEQSKKDTNYYDIRLHIHPIKAENNEYWMYVEQAIASTQDKPYRQRIYRVKQLDNTHFVSEIFMIKNEKDWIGKFKNEKELKSMPLNIDQKMGCSVFLELMPDHTFKGSTHEADCLSSLRGATYATSEVVITEKMLVSWDRGFDDTKKQVWGAVKAGYNFVKSKAN